MATPSIVKVITLAFPLACLSALGRDPIAVSTTANAASIDCARQIKLIEDELRGNILPFWLNHTRDRQNGGFFGQIDNDLVVRNDAPRGALLTTRILWTFSAAYRRYHDPAYLEMAQWAYDDLLQRFWDDVHGGLFWSVTSTGGPLDQRKIVYVQAFGIYALSEFYRTTGQKAPLDRAVTLYRLLEDKCHDRDNGGWREEFSRDWQVRRARGPRRSAMGSNGQKSQNVHLHVLEAYTNLLRVYPQPDVRASLQEAIAILRDRILDKSSHHLRLFLDEDWTPKSEEISFGHDIEFSWLLLESAEVLGDDDLIRTVKPEVVEIARATLAEGVDPDGGVLGEANSHGITVSFKEWWPQAEASVGLLNAYQVSGDPALLAASLKSWRFIETNLIDRKNGEWFMGVSRDGKTKPPLKVSFWKCPYHNARACMQLIDRFSSMAAPSAHSKS